MKGAIAGQESSRGPLPKSEMELLDRSNPLEVELATERASAYFTTTRKMEAALETLARFDRHAQDTPLNAEARDRRRELLAEAGEQVWCFIIQREAMKLPYYEEIYADFGISDEVRKAMGPKHVVKA